MELEITHNEEIDTINEPKFVFDINRFGNEYKDGNRIKNNREPLFSEILFDECLLIFWDKV